MIEKVKDIVYPELEKGRPNWDLPHTKAVVHHIEQIIRNTPTLKLDREVLIIAAIAHDYGYTGLFKGGTITDHSLIKEQKKVHMEIGSKKIDEILKTEKFKSLRDSQKNEIVHLVSVHDKLEEIDSINERVLVEADTLGALDTDFVKPSFDKESNEKWMNGIRRKRLSLFVTDYGKKKFEELFQKRLDYYSSLN